MLTVFTVFTVLTFLGGLLVGAFVGMKLTAYTAEYAVQRYFLRQGMSWIGVDKHTAEVFSPRHATSPPIWKWAAQDRASRARRTAPAKE